MLTPLSVHGSVKAVLLQYDRRNNRVGFGAAPCQQIGTGELVLDPCDASLTEEARSVHVIYPQAYYCFKPALKHKRLAFVIFVTCRFCYDAYNDLNYILMKTAVAGEPIV